MYACGWHDKKLKTIVSNVGTTLPGSVSVRHRHKIVSVNGEDTTIRRDMLIKRPKMIEDFFEFFSVVDVHDHLRQGSLRMEEAWKTKNWVHRLFATIFGIILTDSYLAYKLHKSRNSSSPPVPYSIFMGRLCKQMIENDPLRATRSTSSNDPCHETPGVCLNHTCHQLIRHPYYSDLRGSGQKPRVRCRVEGCKRKTGTYCITCSKFEQKECRNQESRVMGIFGVCSTGTGRDCYGKHIAKYKID
jgi:hypothetical protein